VNKLAALVLVLSLLSANSMLCHAATINSTATKLRSVQAVFTQEKHLRILASPLISRGTLLFQAPQSLRWEYQEPIHSVLLLHDGHIDKRIERDGSFEQDNGAGVGTMQIILQDIGSWLDGRFSDNPLFSVRRSGPEDLILSPKDPGMETVIQRIELHLGQEKGVVDRVTIVESAESSTVITFSQVVVNQDIPAERFTTP